MRDISTDLTIKTALTPAVRAGSATGGAIDRLGYEALSFVIAAGAWTDGTHTIVAEHSDDDATWSTIPADELVGDLPVIASDDDDAQAYMVGYIGDARYVRLKANVAGGPATGAVIGALVILGRAHTSPADTPTV